MRITAPCKIRSIADFLVALHRGIWASSFHKGKTDKTLPSPTDPQRKSVLNYLGAIGKAQYSLCKYKTTPKRTMISRTMSTTYRSNTVINIGHGKCVSPLCLGLIQGLITYSIYFICGCCYAGHNTEKPH